ncbi:MAG: MBL fold metallo-hydrolase [Acidimicrobiia bacterium]
MRLVVLGSSGTYDTPGRPSSGYLIEHGDTRLWIDAGPGTFSALQTVTDYVTIDAVVISHAHPDHCTDLFGFYHAVRYGARPRHEVPVYCAEGLPERFDAFLSGHEDPRFEHRMFETMDFRVVGDGDEVRVGDFQLRFAAADHPPPTVACRIEADGRLLAYSADTGPAGTWAEVAKDAHLFLCEAGFQGEVDAKPWPHHLTAAEAGEIAKQANARRLMITHLWPTLDPKRSLLEAEATFGKEVELAVPGVNVKV